MTVLYLYAFRIATLQKIQPTNYNELTALYARSQRLADLTASESDRIPDWEVSKIFLREQVSR